MKLRALRSFCVGGGVNVAAGDEFEERSAWQANYWIGLGVVEAVEAEAERPADPPDTHTHRPSAGRNKRS